MRTTLILAVSLTTPLAHASLVRPTPVTLTLAPADSVAHCAPMQRVVPNIDEAAILAHAEPAQPAPAAPATLFSFEVPSALRVCGTLTAAAG